MGWLSNLFRNPFSFLGTRSAKEERLAAYVIREHDRGRPLGEIMDDPYIRNRATEQERARILDSPEVVRAVGEDVIESLKRGTAQT